MENSALNARIAACYSLDKTNQYHSAINLYGSENGCCIDKLYLTSVTTVDTVSEH
jgi:hypothetical protein